MTHVATRPPIEPTNGAIELDFRETAAWSDSYGGKGLTILFGDDDAGPLAYLSSYGPMAEKMPTGFAHGHASDNWRISVRGTTNMGRDEYTEGQFRYHDGGAPYASDNLTWGPNGGFGLVLMADRRGFAINAVKRELAETIDPQQRKAASNLGIEIHNPCPGAPGIATTLGTTERSHLDGGFDSAQDWPEVAPGVRVCIGLAGERDRGPVIMLIDAKPNTEALPERRFSTELMLLPQSGELSIGKTVLDQGSIRVEETKHTSAPVIAGENGVRLSVIFGNRQALASSLRDGSFGDESYATELLEILNGLTATLAGI